MSRPETSKRDVARDETSAGRSKIVLRGVDKRFERRRKDPLRVLDSVDLSIPEHGFVSIIGPSGSGKSTLLFLIAGLDEPSAGEILVDDQPIRGPGRDRGVVFQEDAIFPWRTVQRNVGYGLSLRGMPKAEREERVRHYIDLVKLTGFEDLYPRQLSGGMKKRVAIAEVLANEPEVLLLDEPFGALDYVTKLSLQEELERIWRRSRPTTVLVTHDIEEALFLSDRVIVLRDATLQLDLIVPFERPRRHELRNDVRFNELKERLWREIGGAGVPTPPQEAPH
jgi:NitT/TauT family transport system ATP-binding protein